MKTYGNIKALLVILLLIGASVAFAQDAGGGVLPAGIQIRFDPAGSPQQMSQSLRIFILLTALSLAPSAMIMMTSFTRIYPDTGLSDNARPDTRSVRYSPIHPGLRTHCFGIWRHGSRPAAHCTWMCRK